ncbi:MAG: glycosyltransferase family 39 protein [Candidatus Edwardsbacteria bacterium]
MRLDKVLWFIIVLGLGLRLLFCFFTPLLRGPDEFGHFSYIQYLVEHKQLPVDIYQDGWREYFQPPLYYLICVPAFILFSPWGVKGQVITLRIFTIFFTIGVIALTPHIIRVLFPKDRSFIYGGTAFVAFHPFFARNNSLINNDNLLNLLFSFLLFYLVKREKHGFQPRDFLFLGLLGGIGVLTKTSMLLAFPLLFLTLGWETVKRESGLKTTYFIKSFFLLMGAAFAIAGFWLFRNYCLYHNLMGIGPNWSMPPHPFIWYYQMATLKHMFVTF